MNNAVTHLLCIICLCRSSPLSRNPTLDLQAAEFQDIIMISIVNDIHRRIKVRFIDKLTISILDLNWNARHICFTQLQGLLDLVVAEHYRIEKCDSRRKAFARYPSILTSWVKLSICSDHGVIDSSFFQGRQRPKKIIMRKPKCNHLFHFHISN